MLVAPFAIFTILAVVAGLCALMGNTHPIQAAFWAAASTLIPLIAAGLMQGGGLAAFMIFLSLLAVIPSSVFLLALAWLHHQKKGQAIRPAWRTALALCCLLCCYGAYAIGLADANKERSFAVAIMSNDADKFNRTLRAGPLSFQRSLLQEAPEATRFNLLRRLELPDNWEPGDFDFIWDIILSLPPSADRTELVKRFAALEEMPAPIWVLIAFHDQGDVEDEEIIWNKGRDLDEFIHYSFRRLDLLEEALKRASDDEIRELARYGLSRLATDWPDGALAVAKAKLRLAQREGAPPESSKAGPER
ncbi:hypothetical protein LJC15_04320 [Desulfovibrio sp. OttesenSCG-928-G11]|nr:hypothetical protein [Desulfovibrio sp. OttesenSCG-928-G11]